MLGRSLALTGCGAANSAKGGTTTGQQVTIEPAISDATTKTEATATAGAAKTDTLEELQKLVDKIVAKVEKATPSGTDKEKNMDILNLLNIQMEHEVPAKEYENITLKALKAENNNTLIFYFTYGDAECGIHEYLIEDKRDGYCQIYAEKENQVCNKEMPKEVVMEELEAMLQPVKQWKESYNEMSLEEEDYSWELTYCFSNGKVTSAGFEDAPEDYERIQKAMEEWFENRFCTLQRASKSVYGTSDICQCKNIQID